MSIFDKFQALAEKQERLEAADVQPFGVVTEQILSPTVGVINGRNTILAGTNNYLGLTFDPLCVAAAQAAVRLEGTGTTGSRMANGTYSGHAELERELAEFYGASGAIVFSTGYQAKLGLLSTLVGPGDIVLVDGDADASLYGGAQMSGAEVIGFRHNDPDDLDRRLRSLGERASSAVILVEGVYGLLGERAPLAKFIDIKRCHGALLVVDEAHSLGVLGATGRGLAQEADVENDVDFIIGSFSNSLGTIGGFCVSRRPELELIRFAIRPYIFTASPSPATIASTRQALAIVANRPVLRGSVWDNARRLYKGLEALGFRLGAEISPVVAVMMDNEAQALAFWQDLLEQGVYVNLVLPPEAPKGASLLRCTVSAVHSPKQVNKIIAAFESAAEHLASERAA
jgi:8-amino-7-oxononanoate synthase